MNRAKFDLKKHSALIFSGIAVVGVFGTAVAGVWSGTKASKILSENPDAETWKEKLNLTWKYYALTIVAAIGTSACIIASHRISAKQIAALSSIAAAGATTFNQYRDKVREVIGNDAEEELYKEVKQKTQWVIHPELPNEGVDLDDESYLYFDGFANRYFRSNPYRIIQAIYHLNRNFHMRGSVSVNEWYDMLGIDGIEGGDEITWDADDFFESGLIDQIDIFKNESVVEETGEKCTGIFFDWDPGTLHEDWR